MPSLYYCYISIFGSALEVEELKSAIGDPGATVGSLRLKSPEGRSSIPAIQIGNVREWRSSKEYYIRKTEAGSAVPVWNYTAEEEHICHCVRRWMLVKNVLPKFQTETTEIWLHIIYKARVNEHPAGVFFGKGFLDLVHELGASITTEVIFKEEQT